jgi:citrate lyase subunit beta/citryl-CoA lyase
VKNPREILLGSQAVTGVLPVCDHYSGVESRMRKSLQLQADMIQEFGACVFDVTLDCEDGAPVGGEHEHAHMVASLALHAQLAARAARSTAKLITPRVAVRVHPVNHPAFAADVETIVSHAGAALCHLMIPKIESVADVDVAVRAVDRASANRKTPLPLHVLIESPAAVHQAFDIAAHPRVQSLSFGLMDFVSAHGGAIPATGMTVQGQFSHPLVLRAKLEIASACHAHGKVPSHCVVTEFSDKLKLQHAAHRAAAELGYTRMWSIHPDQIRPILAAFAPDRSEVESAANIVFAASLVDWAPISVGGQLHDRASYRYYWQLLERAQQTGLCLPPEVQHWFAPHSIDSQETA